MIIAIGTDLCAVPRIARLLEPEKRAAFLERCYTAAEQALAPAALPGQAAYFAGRWAAKEAVSKALGTGIGEYCGWRDVEVLRQASGAPLLQLSGAAARRATSLGIASWHLSISHEREHAVAFVVAEA